MFSTAPPVPLCLFACDVVWIDPATLKGTIQGIYHDIHAVGGFPHTRPQLMVFFSMFRGEGTVPIEIRVVGVDAESQPIAVAHLESKFNGPESISQTWHTLENVTFPTPGEYRIQLFADGEYLREFRLAVLPTPPVIWKSPPSDAAPANPMPLDLPPPVPLALVICDAVWQDPATHKFTLFGMYHQIVCQSFPATYPRMTVFLMLTEGQGVVDLDFRIIAAGGQGEPVYRMAAALYFAMPNAVVHCPAELKNVQFPAAGDYRLQLFAHHALLAECPLYVKPM